MTPAARNVILGAPFDPYRLGNNAAAYSLSSSPSDATYLYDGSNRLYYVADRSGNSAVNGLVCNAGSTNSRATATLTGQNLGTSDWTFSFFVQYYTAGISNGFAQISPSTTSGEGQGRSLNVNFSSANDFRVYLYGATTSDFNLATISGIHTTYLGVMLHVCITQAAGTLKIYLNGVDTAFTASTGGTPSGWNGGVTSTYLGIGHNTASNVLNGVIYNDALYNRALSQAEVTALRAANGAPAAGDRWGSMTGPVAGCLVYHDMASAAKLATSVADASSNGLNLALTQPAVSLPIRIHGARDLYQGLTASMPTYLAYSGTKFGYLNGVAGNYLSAPDSAALSITGDIDVRVSSAAVDWTPSAAQALISKRLGAGVRSWQFLLNTNGTLQFSWSADGTNFINAVSTVAPTVSNFGSLWVRATLDVDNGAGGNTATFYTSIDGATWTLLGSPVITASTTSIFDSTTVVEVGSLSGGTANLLIGNIFRAQIYNGIAGTLVADFNPALFTSGTTFTASTGEVWTRNAGAYIGNGGEAYLDGTADYLKSAPYSLSQPESVYFTGSQVSWTAGDTLFDGNANDLGHLQQDTLTPRLRAFAGTPLAFISPTLGVSSVLTTVFNGASGSIRWNKAAPVTGAVGAFNMGGFTIGTVGGATASWANITWSEALLRSAADADALQLRIAAFEMRKWGIAG